MQEHCSFLGMIGEGSKPSSIIGRTKALAVARPFLGMTKINRKAEIGKYEAD